MSFTFLKRVTRNDQRKTFDNSKNEERDSDDDLDKNIELHSLEANYPVRNEFEPKEKNNRDSDMSVDNPMNKSRFTNATNKSSLSNKLENIVSIGTATAPNYCDEIIFDSIAPNLDWLVFWKQLIAHVFVFLAPCLIENPVAQGFYGRSIAKMFYNTILAMVVYLVIVTYLALDHTNFDILAGACLIPVIYFVQHKLIIAVKYSSLTTSEYQRLMNCDDDKLYGIYSYQLQLISGWLNRDETIINFEVNAACIRIGQTLGNLYFMVPYPNDFGTKLTQFRNWVALLRGMRFIDTQVKPSRELQLVEVIKRNPNKRPSSVNFNLPPASPPASSTQQHPPPQSSPPGTPTNSSFNRKTVENFPGVNTDRKMTIESQSAGANWDGNTNRGSECSSAWGKMQDDNNKYYRLSAHDLCLTLIRRCDERAVGSNNLFYYGTLAYNLMNLSIPILVLLGNCNHVNWRDPFLYLFLIFSTMINFFYGLVVYNLLYVAIFGKQSIVLDDDVFLNF
jgi:hypothetical protein